MDQDCVAGGGEGEAKRPSTTHVCQVKAAPEQQSKTCAVFALPEGEESVSPSGFFLKGICNYLCKVSGLQAELLFSSCSHGGSASRGGMYSWQEQFDSESLCDHF